MYVGGVRLQYLSKSSPSESTPAIMNVSRHSSHPGMQTLYRALCEEQDTARLYGRNPEALYEEHNLVFSSEPTHALQACCLETNVTVATPICLKIRYKDYISQTHPIYFS